MARHPWMMRTLAGVGFGLALLVLAAGAWALPARRAAAQPLMAAARLTPTPTPAPQAELRQPFDNATLPQPTTPGAWQFSWRGPRCGHQLILDGPAGRRFVSPSMGGSGPPPSSFSYAYQATEALPPSALGPWYWHIEYTCGTYSGTSETRVFWVEGGNIAK